MILEVLLFSLDTALLEKQLCISIGRIWVNIAVGDVFSQINRDKGLNQRLTIRDTILR